MPARVASQSLTGGLTDSLKDQALVGAACATERSQIACDATEALQAAADGTDGRMQRAIALHCEGVSDALGVPPSPLPLRPAIASNGRAPGFSGLPGIVVAYDAISGER